jgi:thiol:disulfide interchange protein
MANKKLVLVIGVLTLIIIFSSGCFEDGDRDKNSSSKIQWKGYDEATLAANTSGKPIMVDFYADWCGPCREMDKTTYRNEKIIELSMDFECAKVNVDDEPELSNDYEIEYIPTTVFLSPTGVELNRIVGYIDADELHQEMVNVKNLIGNNTLIM